MQSVRFASGLLVTLALTSAAHATSVAFNYVTVRDPGNAADTLNSRCVSGIGSAVDICRIRASCVGLLVLIQNQMRSTDSVTATMDRPSSGHITTPPTLIR